MRKMLTVLLTMAMLSTMLVGCGNAAKVETPNTNEVVDEVTPSTQEPEDTNVSEEVPEVSEPVVEEPIVEITPPAPVGVVVNHSNGWYRCEPSENGMYKYEMYSMDLDTTYAFEIPILPEELSFKYAWNDTRSDYDFEFKRDGFIFWVHPTFVETLTKLDLDGFEANDLTIETNYFEHYENEENYDTFIWEKKYSEGTNKIAAWLTKYDYENKCAIEVGLTVTDQNYDSNACNRILKTWTTIENNETNKIKNEFSAIDEIVTKEFRIGDISALANDKELQMSVMGSFDRIKPYGNSDLIYPELMISLNSKDFNVISPDILVSIFETLFGENELYVYGTEEKLNEFPTSFTTDSIPYFYYYLDEETCGTIYIEDTGVLKIYIEYSEK